MRVVAISLLLVLAACASEEPSEPSLSFSGERVDVKVLGDGFVICAAGRVPLEDFVLRMRQKMRGLGRDHAGEVWVHLDVDRDGGEGARLAVGRLFDELKNMGVQQVEFL